MLPTYARADLTIARGEGARVWDSEGREYLDFAGGIAVVSLGHCHAAPLAAAQEQLALLWHASNLYRTAPAEELARRLSERFGGAQAFLCNSGAEAVEAALKYARKATGRPGVVALEGSFHGRTLGALSVTGQPAKSGAFEPLLPGVRFVPPNDTEALVGAVDAEVGLILLEPILGEGGVIPLDVEFVSAAAELPPLLCFDEVQTGVGRTGTFFAFEQLGVRPDLVALAKGLANGLPIGALLVADEARGAFSPGDHGSTFGGIPSRAPRRAPSSTRSTKSCSTASSSTASLSPRALRPCPVCGRSEGGAFSSEPSSIGRQATSSRHVASAGCLC